MDEDLNYEYLLQKEKYLCKLHRLNSFELLKLEKTKEVELGIAENNYDSRLEMDVENQLDWIQIVIHTRAKLN
jgi:hypothetical protein